jgi:hypothetical protein
MKPAKTNASRGNIATGYTSIETFSITVLIVCICDAAEHQAPQASVNSSPCVPVDEFQRDGQSGRQREQEMPRSDRAL